MNKFRLEVNKLLNESGRKKWWLAQKMNLSVTHLRRKMGAYNGTSTFTEEEKNKIRKFLK